VVQSDLTQAASPLYTVPSPRQSRPNVSSIGSAVFVGLTVATNGQTHTHRLTDNAKKGKGSPYSITERRVPELIPVLGSQPVGDVNHKPDGRLPLLSARPAVTPATLKRAATNFAAW